MFFFLQKNEKLLCFVVFSQQKGCTESTKTPTNHSECEVTDLLREIILKTTTEFIGLDTNLLEFQDFERSKFGCSC